MEFTNGLLAGAGRAGIDRDSGALRSLLADGGPAFIQAGQAVSGLVRMAVPLPEYPSHYLEVGTHGSPEVESVDDGLRLTYPRLTSQWADIDVRVEIELAPSAAGLTLRARIDNLGETQIPQVAFPQLLGLEAVGGVERTRLQLGRRQMLPYQELAMRPHDAWWLERRLQEYIGFGQVDFNMKWLDYGDTNHGVTLYSRNTRYTAQGLAIDRVARDVDRLDLRWVHYPFIEPGESWESGDYVLLLHDGDWYAGARAYQEFAAKTYIYGAPRHIREALGIRSVWPAVRNAPPTFPIRELPEYAKEIADPDLGLAEMVVWHWWLKNGLPIIFDERLGTEQEFTEALSNCAQLGVPISLFVSHRILRQTDETDPSWVHHNAAGQPVGDNWTYGPGFLPRFRVLFMGTHAMVQASPLSPGWRSTGLAEYQRILDSYGGAGICFDVFTAPLDPNFNPAVDGRPDEAGEKLVEFASKAREIIHKHDPEGSFSGEFAADVKVSVLDYTWEWKNSYDIADAAPFRYVFPQFRLNANVGTHPRGALVAFTEGALLNVIPGDMRSHKLSDHPDLVRILRQLAAARRRFLRYFTEGQYRHLEGLTTAGSCLARLYSCDDDILVVVANPSDDATDVTIEVDPTVWGGRDIDRIVTVLSIEGDTVQSTARASTPFRQTLSIPPDELLMVELAAAESTET